MDWDSDRGLLVWHFAKKVISIFFQETANDKIGGIAGGRKAVFFWKCFTLTFIFAITKPTICGYVRNGCTISSRGWMIKPMTRVISNINHRIDWFTVIITSVWRTFEIDGFGVVVWVPEIDKWTVIRCDDRRTKEIDLWHIRTCFVTVLKWIC